MIHINVKRLPNLHEISFKKIDNREILSNKTPYIWHYRSLLLETNKKEINLNGTEKNESGAFIFL